MPCLHVALRASDRGIQGCQHTSAASRVPVAAKPLGASPAFLYGGMLSRSAAGPRRPCAAKQRDPGHNNGLLERASNRPVGEWFGAIPLECQACEKVLEAVPIPRER